MNYLIFVIAGYILGSILFSRRMKKNRRNPYLLIVLDLLTGFLPVFAAGLFLDISHPAFILIILAPAFGRVHPFLQKHGTESLVMISLGSLLGLLPVWQPACVLGVTSLLFLNILVPRLYAVILVFAVTAGSSFLLLGDGIPFWGSVFLAYFSINQELENDSGEKLEIRLTRK